jgi:hypothetical protein
VATTRAYFLELIGQECWREAYNISKINIYRNLNISVDLETLEFEVPIVCLVTGCVSLCRDRPYKDRREWDVLLAVVVSRKM